MLSFLPIFAIGLSIGVAWLLERWLSNGGEQLSFLSLYLSFVLPFAAGGFHTYTAACTTVLILLHLVQTVRQKKGLVLVFNLNSVAVLMVLAGFCLTPIWAADRGMAVFGILRYLPVALYTLVLMQKSDVEKGQCLRLIPLCGALMTLFSTSLLLIPGSQGYLTVGGRLAGFFQYPNAFAAFLLVGLILQYSKSTRKRWEYLTDILLVVGIVLSGSKTVFVLLVVAILGIIWIKRNKTVLISVAMMLVLALGVGLIATNFEALRHADRFLSIRIYSDSFLIRLLYFKDVLPMILKNPFGYGYMGYPALEGTFQTGGYFVTYLHNGLLQLLFEVGWVPALLMASAFLRTMISRCTEPVYRLICVVLLGHCMLDFDLQFFVFWMILLTCMDFRSGKAVTVRRLSPVLLAPVLLVSIWLGSGDLLYRLGLTHLLLKVTPFHTDCLCAMLQETDNPDELDALADRILELNPTKSLAYSAKSNAAFSRGDIANMIAYKEQAIRYAPYAEVEYCDYFDKLYYVMALYRQQGDTESASYCKRKLLQIPQEMQVVIENSDPLALAVEDSTRIQLYDRQRQLLQQLSQE